MSRPTAKNHNNPFGPSPATEDTASRELVPTSTPQRATATGVIATNPFDAAHNNPFDAVERNRQIIPTDNTEDKAYKYNFNHSRGAIVMNDYDWDRKGSNLKYDYKKVDAELPKRILWFRKGLYVAQMLILAGAILMGGGAYIAENKGWEFSPNGLIFGHMEKELIYVPYAGSCLCFVIAIVGFVGAKTREKCGKVMLIVYIALVGIALILAIASTSQSFADAGNVFHYADRQWGALTDQEEKTFEFHNFCCNFNTIEPCCRLAYGVTDCVNEYFCFEIVEPHLIEQFTIIGVTSAIQSVILLLVIVVASMLVCYMSYQTHKQKKKLAEQQQQSNMRHIR